MLVVLKNILRQDLNFALMLKERPAPFCDCFLLFVTFVVQTKPIVNGEENLMSTPIAMLKSQASRLILYSENYHSHRDSTPVCTSIQQYYDELLQQYSLCWL